MKAYALLGGPTSLWPLNIKTVLGKAHRQNDLIVGVDRGALYLEDLGIIPDLAIGDFDSLKKADLAKVEKNIKDIRYSNPVKDWTDSELMLNAVLREYQVDQLIIYGATGGRIDHFLLNLLMLLNPTFRKFATKVILLDQQNKIIWLNAGKHLISRDKAYSYFGVANLTAVEHLNIIGARYALKNYSSDYPRVFSSNEFLPGSDHCQINFDQGLVSVIYSKDIDRFHNLNIMK